MESKPDYLKQAYTGNIGGGLKQMFKPSSLDNNTNNRAQAPKRKIIKLHDSDESGDEDRA